MGYSEMHRLPEITPRTVSSSTEASEGVNTLYKISAISSLLCMNRFKSTKIPKSLTLISNTIDIFGRRLETELDSDHCLKPEELRLHRLLKKKHYYYGAYLSALTSMPILSSANDVQILSSMVAKTSAITSIKVLDNINDRFSNKQEAVESQREHLRAFTEKSFEPEPRENFLERAENSCMSMARWTFDSVSQGLDRASETLRIYLRDFADYIDGQIRSMDEKADRSKPATTIQEYIQKVNEKSVGRIWVDIDFCFLEKSLGKLDQDELKAILYVRKAADYFFKGCNLYDDIADLDEDLKLGILSSVPLLALDRGRMEESDLRRDRMGLLKILRKREVINEVLQLADLIFLQGFKPLLEAKELNEVIDIDALIFGAKVLRIFAIRKWVLRERSFNSLCKTAVSFGNPRMYRISDHVAAYAKYI